MVPGRASPIGRIAHHIRVPTHVLDPSLIEAVEVRSLPEHSRVAPVAVKTAAVRLLDRDALFDQNDRLEQYVARSGHVPLSYHPAWLSVFADGLGHVPYCLEAVQGEETRGLLPLAFVQSVLFGKYLAGLPYLNMGEAQPTIPASPAN